MNIFSSLRKYARPYYSIFEYKGNEIFNEIAEYWGANSVPNINMYSERHRDIITLVKMKAFKYRYEKVEGNKLTLEDLIFQLCSGDQELCDDISRMVELSVRIDENLRNFKSKHHSEWANKARVAESNINELVQPVYWGNAYEDFIFSAINFSDEDMNELLKGPILVDWYEPLYFDDTETHTELKEEEFEFLKKFTIRKSNVLDLIYNNGSCYMCVDVNKRFKDGEPINTEKAWLWGQTNSRLSVVIIE